MRMKTKVIGPKYNTPRLPITPTVVGFMAVDYWHLNQLWVGALITLGVIICLATIHSFVSSESSEPVWQTGSKPATKDEK